MILSYSIPGFPALVETGVKKHSFRRDKKKRWRPGMTIAHWWKSPRNKSQNPYHIKDGVAVDVCGAVIMLHPGFEVPLVCIDGTFYDVETVAKNDGFANATDFVNFFRPNMFQTGSASGRDGIHPIFEWHGRLIMFEPWVYTPDPEFTIKTVLGGYTLWANHPGKQNIFLEIAKEKSCLLKYKWPFEKL